MPGPRLAWPAVSLASRFLCRRAFLVDGSPRHIRGQMPPSELSGGRERALLLRRAVARDPLRTRPPEQADRPGERGPLHLAVFTVTPPTGLPRDLSGCASGDHATPYDMFRP